MGLGSAETATKQGRKLLIKEVCSGSSGQDPYLSGVW